MVLGVVDVVVSQAGYIFCAYHRSNVLERLIKSRSDSRDSLVIRSSLRLLPALGARPIRRLTKLRFGLALIASMEGLAGSMDDLREPVRSST